MTIDFIKRLFKDGLLNSTDSRMVMFWEGVGPLDKRKICSVLDLDPSMLKVTAGQALAIWFATIVRRLNIAESQKILLVEEFLPKVASFGNELIKHLEVDKEYKELPVAYFGIADRKYATITGDDSLLIIDNGERVPGSKVQFLETIQYNLTTLFIHKTTEMYQSEERAAHHDREKSAY